MNIFKIFKKKKSKMEELFEEISKAYFPEGEKQIEKQSEEIVKLSNNKLGFDKAKSLLIKSTAILVLNKGDLYDYIKRNFGDGLNEKEIKSIVGYVILKTSGEGVNKFIDIEFGTDDKGYDDDEIPVGFGEFGRCLTNPIPVRGIAANEAYLEKLSTKDNKKIKWERLGSQESKVKGINGVIDIYKITTEDNNGLGELYIFPYNRKTSNKAPIGFKIEDGGIIVNSDRDLRGKVHKAKKYKKEGKLLEALGIYNQVFDFLSQEAANYAHKLKNIKDTKSIRQITPDYFRDSKEFLKKNDLVCKISNNMGIIFAELGDYKSAEKFLKQAIELTPDSMEYKDPYISLERIKEELNK